MISKEENSNPRSTRRKRFHNDDGNGYTSRNGKEKRNKSKIDLNGDQAMTTTCVFLTNTGIRQLDGSRSGGAIWTKPHIIITHCYINIYTMSDNQEREEAHTGDISDGSIATTQERRTRLYDRFLFLEGKRQRRRSPTGPSSKASKAIPISHLERLCGM